MHLRRTFGLLIGTVFLLQAADLLITQHQGSFLHLTLNDPRPSRDGSIELDSYYFQPAQGSVWASAQDQVLELLILENRYGGLQDLVPGMRIQVVTGQDRHSGVLQSATAALLSLRDKDELRLIRTESITDILLEDPPGPMISVRQKQNESDPLHSIDYGFHCAELSWTAEYDLIRLDQEQALLRSWFRISNRGDGRLENARIQLLAGEIVNERADIGPVRPMAKSAMFSAEAVGLEAEQTLDHYFYAVEGTMPVQPRSEKRHPLYSESTVSTERRYIVRGYDARPAESAAVIELTFIHKSPSAAILPAGSISIFDEGMRWQGTASIRQYAAGEKVEISAGTAHDLRYERVITDQKRMRNYEDVEILYKLHNRSPQERIFLVRDRISGNRTVRDNTVEYVKRSADTIEFSVTVPAASSVEFSYAYSKVF